MILKGRILVALFALAITIVLPAMAARAEDPVPRSGSASHSRLQQGADRETASPQRRYQQSDPARGATDKPAIAARHQCSPGRAQAPGAFQVLHRRAGPSMVADREVPPESVISEGYIATGDRSARTVSLKEAIYLALRNNPNIQSAQLNPLLSLESVRQSEAAFDPDLTSKIDVEKTVTPSTSILQTGGATAYATKEYDWNFAANKLLSTTNGTLGLTFDNNRIFTKLGVRVDQSVVQSFVDALAVAAAAAELRAGLRDHQRADGGDQPGIGAIQLRAEPQRLHPAGRKRLLERGPRGGEP